MKPSEKDTLIFLEFVVFRFLVFEILWRRHFRGKKAAAVASWIKRHCAEGWIRGRQLDKCRKFYQLTDKAVAHLRSLGHRVSRSTSSPPKGYAKAVRYAALLYCTNEKEPHILLYRPSEHLDKFPDLAAHIEATNTDPFRQKIFYADGDTLGYLVLDRGQHQFFGRKVLPHLQSLFGRKKRDGANFLIDPDQPGWPSMRLRLEHNKFRLTLVTVTDARRYELEREIKRAKLPHAQEVVVLPDIANVLPTRRRLESTATKQPLLFPQEKR